jgi:hypothetical protein
MIRALIAQAPRAIVTLDEIMRTGTAVARAWALGIVVAMGCGSSANPQEGPASGRAEPRPPSPLRVYLMIDAYPAARGTLTLL